MKLATVGQLRERLQGGDNALLNGAYDRALLATTPHLETLIRTDFSRKVVKDIWYVDFNQFPQRSDRLKFYLTQSFVDKDEPFTMKTGVTLEDLDTAIAEDTKFFRIDKTEAGILSVFGSESLTPPFFQHRAGLTHVSPFGISGHPFTGHRIYYQFEYTAGFVQRGDQSGAKFYRGVPEWLQEGALQLSREIYLKDVDVLEKDVEKAAAMLSNTRGMALLLSQAERMMNRHVRFHPDAQKPLLTEITGDC